MSSDRGSPTLAGAQPRNVNSVYCTVQIGAHLESKSVHFSVRRFYHPFIFRNLPKKKNLTMASYGINDNQNYFVKEGRTSSRVLNPPGGKCSITLGTYEEPKKSVAGMSTMNITVAIRPLLVSCRKHLKHHLL